MNIVGTHDPPVITDIDLDPGTSCGELLKTKDKVEDVWQDSRRYLQHS